MRRKVHENHDFLSRIYFDLKEKLKNEKDTIFRSRIWKCHLIQILTTFCNQKRYCVIFVFPQKTGAGYQSLTLIIPPPFFIPAPPLVFDPDSEISGGSPAGPRLRGPTASVHINISACHIVVNECLNFYHYLFLRCKKSNDFFLAFSSCSWALG